MYRDRGQMSGAWGQAWEGRSGSSRASGEGLEGAGGVSVSVCVCVCLGCVSSLS